jgi:hypothetical protein
METCNGTTASSTEVMPAGHAALTETEARGENQPDSQAGLAGLSVALGVVFGDIGTSPVYTFVSASILCAACPSTQNMCSGSCP